MSGDGVASNRPAGIMQPPKMQGAATKAGEPMDHHVRHRDWIERIQQSPITNYPDLVRARIEARERGFSEPVLSDRTDDGRIRGGNLMAARILDDELAAAKRDLGR